MKCPHCQQNFHSDFAIKKLGKDLDGTRLVWYDTCPACSRMTIRLQCAELHHPHQYVEKGDNDELSDTTQVWPRNSARPPAPDEVPLEIAADFNDSSLILEDSPRAAAALGRRCLQSILRDKANVKDGNLADEIQQVLDSGKLPSYIAQSVDAIRNIGNFAAHPMKSTSPGQILPVEPGEAEWILDVLQSLFDFYYVQPALLKKKQDALNQKLQDAGKRPMKT